MNSTHTDALRRNGTGAPARSETTRRASRMIGWAAIGLVLFGINAALSEVAHQAGLVTYVFPRTLLWSIVPYLAAFLLLHRALHLPAMEGASIVGVATTLPFALLLIVYAGFHIEYSRGAVLVGYGTTLAWIWFGYRRYVQNYVPLFGYLDPQTLQHLNRIIEMPGATPPAKTRFEQIGSIEEALHCDGILVERGLTADPDRTRLLTQYRLGHLRMYSVERIGEMLTGRVGLDHIDENFFDDYADHYLFDYIKRLIDIVAVVVLAPLAVPVGLAVALAVSLETEGGALFRQRRVGLFGKPFTMLKFRSMGVDRHAPAQFALRQDPRVTRVGRVIRKYRLDEIPQLWNVLVGDMSFIGPRPEQVPMVEEFSETIAYYPYRHLVRPGLSGWAQVQQGYVGTHAETVTKLSYDLYYVKHCSFALDLLIAVKTVRTLLTGYGAR
ncbi:MULTISPECIES: exopolysaccharide biosynthesis polyprenyl glycosylphosphotransferase [Cupriavidus]|uniref:Exopolysaccharide biosynthesis polyprenyl glycosylphosphotransferase n=1 Tax=Cupriavidus pauculus TaxID=82633 RepID=A0A3G8GZN6_9BURK|nr:MULTISPECIES: exopolysaccharide biosynthesis polyprenyl glycosylphosphotransferase [Cupriavidus]AZG13634.1 exopolysaccharide biosynthesis polyprenyl glycosylphosphotransferase [Cupriavidus pauculus]MDT6960338.1 exopolysaccharide biosynthesis polyprenyl glycosylphosphotransferase [Cupriavidus sp. SZY C1]